MKFPIKRTGLASVVLAAALSVSAFAYNLQGGTVNTASSVNLRASATTSADVVGKLTNGARVAVLDKADGWYQVAFNGTNGYVSADYLETQDIMNVECGGAKVTASVLNMRSAPTTDASIVTKLSKGVVAKIVGINNSWFKIQYDGKSGYICPDYVTVVPYTGSGSSGSAAASASAGSASGDILDYAASLLGCKYVYGGTSPSGFDCSGYTRYVYDAFGVSLSHSSSAQYSSCDKVKKSELQAGDLVFFSSTSGGSSIGHVGIYVGDGQFIHAASPGKGVRYDSLSSDYYSSHYVGAGRVTG